MILDLLKNSIEQGLLCGTYKDKVFSSTSKKQIADVGLDANGVHWLCEIRMKGFDFDYDIINKEFKNFINGKYHFTSKPNDNGASYTSSMYCCYNENVTINTTVTSFLNCKTKITIDEYDYVSIHLDSNCDVDVFCPKKSKCRIYLYGNAIVRTSGEGSVKIINVNKDECN